MSQSLSSGEATAGSIQLKYRRSDNKSDAEVQNVLNKFSVSEQMIIRRNFEELPKSIFSIWRENFKHLDLQDIQQQLKPKEQQQFLRRMRRHFRSVHFRIQQLQDELNVLDRSGIAELPGVLSCQISCDGAKECPQWPLHALPKLLSQLSCLQMHMPVQVGFIGQFSQLQSLTLYDEITCEALAVIWANCRRLESVQLLGSGYSNLHSISLCLELRELTLPMDCFNASSAFEILQMPQLRLLQLQQGNAPSETTKEAMALVLRQRRTEIQRIQISGQALAVEDWLHSLELQRCTQLESLTLIDCRFGELNESRVGYLPVLTHLAFCHCSDLEDNQLLSFVKASPQLLQLSLIDCAQLTGKLLHNLCNLRCMEQPDAVPLGLYLQDCTSLQAEYELHFSAQSSLQLLKQGQAYRKTQHVQFIFYSSEST